jgi:paraquat-inducible protein A
VVCHSCEAVHRRTPVAHGAASCVVCGATLYRGGRRATVEAILGLTLTAVIGFGIAIAAPLVVLDASGRRIDVSLWDAATVATGRGYAVVAIVLGVTLVAAPMVEMALLLWVLVPLAARVHPPGFSAVMQVIRQLRPWRMIEVFLLGVVIAIVKLAGMAKVTPAWGVFGIAVMTVALASIGALDRATLWRRHDEVVA